MWYVNVKWYLPILPTIGRLQTRFACLNPHNRHRLTPYRAGIATVTTTSIIIAGLRASTTARTSPPTTPAGALPSSSRSARRSSSAALAGVVHDPRGPHHPRCGTSRLDTLSIRSLLGSVCQSCCRPDPHRNPTRRESAKRQAIAGRRGGPKDSLGASALGARRLIARYYIAAD